MALDVDALVAQRDAALALKAQLLASPNPDYIIAGRSIKWGTYLKQVEDSIVGYNALIDVSEGPIENHSEGFG